MNGDLAAPVVKITGTGTYTPPAAAAKPEKDRTPEDFLSEADAAELRDIRRQVHANIDQMDAIVQQQQRLKVRASELFAQASLNKKLSKLTPAERAILEKRGG